MENYQILIADTEGPMKGYQRWVDAPDLRGPQGMNDFELAKERGFTGTIDEWLNGLRGPAGKSAYELAKDEGFPGTLPEWLESLKGKVVEVPGKPQAEIIPRFVSALSGKILISEGEDFKLQSPNKPYSFAYADNLNYLHMRMELHSLDWVKNLDENNKTHNEEFHKNRCEVYDMLEQIAFDKDFYVSYEMLLEPGADQGYTNASYGCYVMQFHSTEEKSKVNVLPNMYLKLEGQGKITVLTAGDSAINPPKYPPQINQGQFTVKRGEWVKIQMRIRNSWKGNGELDVYANNIQVVSKKGITMGVPDTFAGQLKLGAYRTEHSSVFAVQFRKIKTGLTSDVLNF